MDLLFIFILIFIATTIFNAISNARQKKGNERRSRPGTGPPRQTTSDDSGNDRKSDGGMFGDLKRQFEEMMNDEHPTDRAPQADRDVYREEKAETSETLSDIEQQRERFRRERESAKQRLESTNVPVTSGKSTRSKQAPSFTDLSGNHVVKGVIWSEVLGEPRARKPHRTNRMIKR